MSWCCWVGVVGLYVWLGVAGLILLVRYLVYGLRFLL